MSPNAAGGAGGANRPTGSQPGRMGGTGLGTGGNYTPFRTSSAPPATEVAALPKMEVETTAAPATEARGGALEIAQATQLIAPMPPLAGAPASMAVPYAPQAAPAGGGEEQAYAPSTASLTPTITADTATNTLLIMAPPAQLEMVKSLLTKLDCVPSQVYIEALIAEVSLSKDNSLGFQWQGLNSQYTWKNGQQTIGNFSNNLGLSNTATGLVGSIMGPDQFQATLNALQQDSNAKILSRPSIFTKNNQAATITVADNIPMASGTIQTNDYINTQIQYQNVGIVLNVTPRVTAGDMVDLDVDIQANEVGNPVSVGGQSYPSTLNREANSSLSVASGHTVVLGGLMKESLTSTKNGVPLLCEIPLVGSLFRYSETNRQKTELLVFITPRVIRDSREQQQLSESERDKLTPVPRSLRRPLDAQGLAASEGRPLPR